MSNNVPTQIIRKQSVWFSRGAHREYKNQIICSLSKYSKALYVDSKAFSHILELHDDTKDPLST